MSTYRYIGANDKSIDDSLAKRNTVLDKTCLLFFSYIYARGVMVIAVGNGHGDTSSNPGRD